MDRIVRTLTAYNGCSSDDQVTEYQYATAANNYDASLATLTKYPDGDTTDDNVKMTYNVDGSLATRTDQRGIVLTNVYDSNRAGWKDNQCADETSNHRKGGTRVSHAFPAEPRDFGRFC